MLEVLGIILLGNDPTELVERLQLRIKETKGNRSTKTIAIFDLVGSTPLKLKEGHTIGTRTALLHNLICRDIANRYNGQVIKELGDGLIIAFDDPVSACCAAVEIKRASQKKEEILTRAGLTIGEVEEIEIAGIRDLLGSTIDRCARIETVAAAGQILLDSTLHAVVLSFLKDYPDICIGPPKAMKLRGIGSVELYELSTKDVGLVSFQRIPFSVYEEGRLLISEKVDFMQNASHEIIELGIGLTTFTEYFTSRRKSEFKDHIINMLERGVTLKCMLLDPNSKIAAEYAKDRGEDDLVENIRLSIKELKKLQMEFEGLKFKGSFEIFAYNHFPYFHAVCIDPDMDVGRMTISHYMHGIRRAETPVFQLCKEINRTMFDKYWKSIKTLLEEGHQL